MSWSGEETDMLRPIAIATAVSGTLDILFAMILTVLFGRQVDNMLRFVASGPFPSAPDWGTAGAVLGLIVHFTLMAGVAAVFLLPPPPVSPIPPSPLPMGGVFG